MSSTRGTHAVPSWVRSGLIAGFATSVQVPVGIVAIELVPAIWLAYPLLLLPLLLSGPAALGRLKLKHALLAAALAGVVSGAVTAVSFAGACKLLGDWFWMLTSAAGAPPMPPLPRLSILPTEWFTWAQQDILFFQPILAVALGLLTLGLRPLGAQAGHVLARVLPRSIGGQLRLAFGALTLLTLSVGMVGFGMIEEMHMRNHRVQLRADWQRQLGTIRATLDEELTARMAGGAQLDPMLSAARGEQVERIFKGLAAPGQRAGLSARPEDVSAALTTYRPAYDQAVSANQRFRSAVVPGETTPAPAATALLADAISALGTLQNRVEADLFDALASNDVTHHERLIAVMGLVALVAGLSLWTGERVLEAIGAPMAVLGVHLRRVARGDFSRRVPAQGPEELRQLGESVNTMTADLARLYDVERERRAMAEAVATREQELSAAKEFWTNTLVHDLKNPLSLIVGWTDILEGDGSLQASQAQAIQQIRQAAEMLDDLVADINDSFRLQATSLPIHRATVSPDELLRGAVTEYRGLDRKMPAVEVAPGVEPVLADARLVGRVLHNLIGNAYKHGGSDARVVLVAEASESASGARVVRFAVDDDGRGIPEGERECVFERFIQGESAARGSGLGLAFCKLVIEQLGGRIWADGSPIGGTRIAFELPCARSQTPTLPVGSADSADDAAAGRQATRVA